MLIRGHSQLFGLLFSDLAFLSWKLDVESKRHEPAGVGSLALLGYVGHAKFRPLWALFSTQSSRVKTRAVARRYVPDRSAVVRCPCRIPRENEVGMRDVRCVSG